MIFRPRTALVFGAFLGTVGCADEPIVIHLDGQATHEFSLQPEAEPLSADRATYRWELVVAPDGSTAKAPPPDAQVTFVPDVRGSYLIERWLASGLAEELTYRFVIDAVGEPPVARVIPNTLDTERGTVTLDGTASLSPEGRPLLFKWRLASRPRDSAAALDDPTRPTVSFVADVAGVYTAELDVFDGELWSLRTEPIRVVAR